MGDSATPSAPTVSVHANMEEVNHTGRSSFQLKASRFIQNVSLATFRRRSFSRNGNNNTTSNGTKPDTNSNTPHLSQSHANSYTDLHPAAKHTTALNTPDLLLHLEHTQPTSSPESGSSPTTSSIQSRSPVHTRDHSTVEVGAGTSASALLFSPPSPTQVVSPGVTVVAHATHKDAEPTPDIVVSSPTPASSPVPALRPLISIDIPCTPLQQSLHDQPGFSPPSAPPTSHSADHPASEPCPSPTSAKSKSSSSSRYCSERTSPFAPALTLDPTTSGTRLSSPSHSPDPSPVSDKPRSSAPSPTTPSPSSPTSSSRRSSKQKLPPRPTTAPSPRSPTSSNRRREPPTHLPGFPSKAFTMSMDSPTLRLSPSIISRHKPMPILHLPVIPPPPPVPVPSPNERARARRVRARLRSMPSLPLIGRDSPGDDDSDLEDLTNDDDDDEDDNVALAQDGDDDDKEETQTLKSRKPTGILLGHPSLEGLRIRIPTPGISPSVIKGKQREAEEEEEKERANSELRSQPNTVRARGSTYFTPRSSTTALRSAAADSSPLPTQAQIPVDYFTSRPAPAPPIHSNSHSSRSSPHGPASVFKRVDPMKTPRPRTAVPVPMQHAAPSTPGSDMRPTLYKQLSKSMIDLSSVSMARSIAAAVCEDGASGHGHGFLKEQRATTPSTVPTLSGNGTVVSPSLDESGKAKGLGPCPPYHQTLLRRRSMPTFNPHTLPPPYPSDLPPFRPHHPPHHHVLPREDEGTEQLPPYTNQIYLQAIMPRKMEFSQPGVQAKDRKWRRVMCVLEGTAFKVYKCPPGAAGVGVIGGWWEKRVGVADRTDVTPVERPMSDLRRLRSGPEREMKWEEEEARRARAGAGDGPGTPGASGPDRTGSSRDRLRRESIDQPPPVSPARSFLSVASLLKPSRINRRSMSGVGSGSSLFSSSANTSPSPSRASLSTSRPSLFESRASPRASSSSNTSTPPRHSMSSARPHLGSSPLSLGTRSSPHPSSSSTSQTASSSSYQSRSRRRRSGSTALTTPSSHSTSYTTSHNSNNPNSRNVTILDPPPPSPVLFTPDPADLLRSYTLQNAESGLGNDYVKRKNVIRARMEGEQFLLQAKDVAEVVEWIEGIHAGTNVSLDLDERPMPRGPIFPRRRRRRRPAAERTHTQTTPTARGIM